MHIFRTSSKQIRLQSMCEYTSKRRNECLNKNKQTTKQATVGRNSNKKQQKSARNSHRRQIHS